MEGFCSQAPPGPLIATNAKPGARPGWSLSTPRHPKAITRSTTSANTPTHTNATNTLPIRMKCSARDGDPGIKCIGACGRQQSEHDTMSAEYAPYIIPICAAVVVGVIAWLLWLRWRGD